MRKSELRSMATKKGSEQRDEKINDVKQAMKENSDMIQ